MVKSRGGGINTNVILDGTTAPTALNVESGKHYVCCLQKYDNTQTHLNFSNIEELQYLSTTAYSSSYNAVQCVIFKATSNIVEITNGTPYKVMLIQLD